VNGNQKINHASDIFSNSPLKFLFISWEGLGGDLAKQLLNEENEIKFYIKTSEDDDILDGIVEKVPEWEPHIDWADIIVIDDTGFGKIADGLRRSGKKVIGCSEYTDRLEEDREFGQSEMKRVGMSTLPSWNFTEFDEAIAFIEKNPGRYVFKPSGSITSKQKGVLFIGEEESGSDLLEVLEHNKKGWARKFKKFQLQKHINGVEVAAGAFFNGKDFIHPVNINFEHKKLFPGDIGLSTIEMGTLMYWSDNSSIFSSTLEKMKQPLADAGYVGYIDINCIANNNAVYPLEFTSRFGYPTISIQLEGILTKTTEWLAKLAEGPSFELKTRRGFQIGIVIATPPFPFRDRAEADIYRDLSIVFKKQNFEGIHFGYVKFIEGDYRIAGGSGYTLVITGSGTTVDDARRIAYNRIDNIILQNKFYRTDIGTRWSNDSDKLRTWGYLQ